MTTPPGTVSVVGVLSALVLGALLIVGAFEVPIPTFRADVAQEARGTWNPVSSGTVAGVVTDATSGEPLEHIQFWVPGTGLGGLSNSEGQILLTGVPAGEHEVVAERVGYRKTVQAVTVAEGETTTLDVRLAEAAVAIPGTVVTAAGEVWISPEPDTPAFPKRVSPGIPGRPIFTPFSVAPTVVNEEEIRSAMTEVYPLEAAGGGTVRLYLFVDENGDVQDYRIDESSGQRVLDDAALAVAGVYRFSPALNRDARVPVWVAFPITFVGPAPATIPPAGDRPELQSLLDELESTRAELRALRERYSDEYPPVRELRARIRKIEASISSGVRSG